MAQVPALKLNVTAVAGRDGFALIDTGSYERETRLLLAGLAAALEAHDLPYRALAVVNTHGHFDHCYGNAEVLRQFPDACVIGHEALPDYLRIRGEEGRTDAVRFGMPEADMAAVRIVPPTRLVTRGGAEVYAVGRDRSLVLEAVPDGAHTCADLVVYVPHCGLVVAGDLVEQSGPPACGPDSFPFTWPDAIRGALDIACLAAGDADGPDDTGGVRGVLPGHGEMVDTVF
ncbi:MAG TPA: MBL fold metallo-hydrolase, partial [Yinghuangia sp.]|nr:MBL fold metallo-hydrolase [Yinghuangia sp.]